MKKDKGEKENVRSRATKELTSRKKGISVGTKVEEAEIRYEKQDRDSSKDRTRSGQQKVLIAPRLGGTLILLFAPSKLNTIVKLIKNLDGCNARWILAWSLFTPWP